MDTMAMEMRREYLRTWRAAHKDKVRQYNAAYWERKAQERKKAQDIGKEEHNGETVPEKRGRG